MDESVGDSFPVVVYLEPNSYNAVFAGTVVNNLKHMRIEFVVPGQQITWPTVMMASEAQSEWG